MTDRVPREFEATELRALKRDVLTLKLVNWFGYASLPVAALLAGLAVVTKAFIIFAIAMGMVVVTRVLSLHYARSMRAAMDARLHDLEARNVLHPDEVEKIISIANMATVAGPAG